MKKIEKQNSVHERLALFFDENKVNITALSKLININRQSMYNYLDGSTSMKIVDLEKILTIYPNLNVNWLFRGDDLAPEVNEPMAGYQKNTMICVECKTKDRIIESLMDSQTIIKQALHDCKKQLQLTGKQPEEKRKAG
jgi:hypothetical protein